MKSKMKTGKIMKPMILCAAVLACSMSLLHAMVVTQPLKLSAAESKTSVTTPDPCCSLVLLETHSVHALGVTWPWQHSYLVLMVGEHSKFYNNPDYPEFSWKAGNARYCTVSAGPGGTGGKFLVTELNRLDDAPRSDVQYSVVVHPPKGESNDKFIQQLLKGDAHYHDHYNSDKVKYDKDPDGHCNFNSNSFTSGLLNAILFGKTPQEPPLAVGWDHPLSSIYFRISDFLHKG